MSTRAPSSLGVALGQIRYRFALAVIGLGVFFGWLLACVVPLCIYASYFDAGGPISETFRLTLTGGIALTTAVLTYRCRRWIIRKASEEALPQPVSAKHVTNAGVAVAQLVLTVVGSFAALVATLIALIITAVLVYGGYPLLTTLSVTMAILIGAAVIALAILAAASR